jgi:hypothetical protein
MKHQLGVVSRENITAVRELSESEYEEYKKAAGRLANFSSSQQLYAIVTLNYDDYGNILKQYGRHYAENPRAVNWIIMEKMVLNINRHLLNFLSAVRTFLDHTETKLKKHYGSDSHRYKRFKDACSQAYDTNFSYRFLYRLRNFAQHCGLPLGTLTLHSTETPPHSGHVQHSLEVKFNRDELLLERDLWGNQLMKEIETLPEQFEITPHVAETMKCLEKINLTVIEDDLQELLQSAEYIQQLVNPIKDMPGLPCILEVKKYCKGKELKLEITNIPFHVVKMVMNIKAHLEPAKECL